MGLGDSLECSDICSGGFLPLGGLLERSRGARGPKKSNPGGPWTALKKIPREVSALLGPKGLPKGGQNWAQNDVQKRFKLKMLKSENPHTVHRICLLFKILGARFGSQSGVQNGIQNGIATLKALKSLLEASWNSVGALRSQKNVLSRFWALLKVRRG